MIHLEIAHINAQLNNHSFIDTVAIKNFVREEIKKADYARDKQQSQDDHSTKSSSIVSITI